MKPAFPLVYYRHGSRPVIYFRINKVAPQSLTAAFEATFGRGVSLADRPIQPDALTVAFIRHPLDRLVSCWKNQMDAPTTFSKTLFKDGMHKSFWRFSGIHPGMHFDAFARAVCEIPDNQANAHFASQHSFICDDAGNVIPRLLFRFEDLAEGFAAVCRAAGAAIAAVLVDSADPAAVDLPWLNRSDFFLPWPDYYSPGLERMVCRRYKEDLDLYRSAVKMGARYVLSCNPVRMGQICPNNV
jgi:hypothetical protein